MRKTLLTLIALFSLNLSAQMTADWYAAAYGPDIDYSGAMTRDNNGNLISAGSCGLSISFAGTVFNGNSEFDQGIFIAKYTQTGQFFVAKRLPATDNATVSAVKTDANGNIFITGEFNDSVDFDPSAAQALITATSPRTYLAKYSPLGDFVWVRTFTLSEAFYEKNLAVDSAGNVYLAGTYDVAVDMDPSANTAILPSEGFAQLFVASYDAAGNYRWAFPITADSAFQVYGLEIHQNTVYVAGNIGSGADFDPTTSVATSNPGVFVARYATNGNFESVFNLAGDNSNLNLHAMAIDTNGSVILTGTFSDSLDFDPSAADVTLVPQNGNAIFIVKYLNNGTFAWVKSMAGTEFKEANRITTDPNGNIALAGNFRDTFDLDPGPNDALITAAFGFDIFVTRLDANGNFLNGQRLGHDYDSIKGDNYDRLGDIVLLNDAFYISGGIAGDFDFDGSGPLVPMENDPDNYQALSAFLAKYTVTPFLSVPENIVKTAFLVYPNPTSGVLNISNLAERIELFDLSGRKLKGFGSETTQIDLSGFSTGTYILRSDAKTIKIVKQ